MYEQNVIFSDVYKGCLNGCIYCEKSFQRQAKRRKKYCLKCYSFEPHNHFERMKGKTQATSKDQFIFFPKGADLCFAKPEEFKEIIAFIKNNPQTRFLIQTKQPEFLLKHTPLPENILVGITLESTKINYDTPSKFTTYKEISPRSTPLIERAEAFAKIHHKHKSVTIEPILQFSLEGMVETLSNIKPKMIFIGYDSKKCQLPEPKLEETKQLINRLEQEGFNVKQKLIRKAWYE